jgi:hypothetical protein
MGRPYSAALKTLFEKDFSCEREADIPRRKIPREKEKKKPPRTSFLRAIS